jgi:hypothetical protein
MILIAIVAELLALVVKVIDFPVAVSGGVVVFFVLSAWALLRVTHDDRFQLWTRRDWWIVTIFAGVNFVRSLFSSGSPAGAGLVVLCLLCLVLALPTLLISKLPYRYRLLLEGAILLAILAVGGWHRQDPYLASKAWHAAALADQARAWAAESDRPGAQRVYQAEAAWLARRARWLRIQAISFGILGTILPEVDWSGEYEPWPPRVSDRQLLRELAISEAIAAHEVVILQEREREKGLPPAQPP